MCRSYGIAFAVLTAALLATGCNKPIYEKKGWAIDPSDVQSVILDPVKREKKIKIAIKSSAKVNVVVVAGKDQNKAKDDFLNGKSPDKALAKQEGETFDLTFTQPANEEAVVMIRATGGKKADVDIKITN